MIISPLRGCHWCLEYLQGLRGLLFPESQKNVVWEGLQLCNRRRCTAPCKLQQWLTVWPRDILQLTRMYIDPLELTALHAMRPGLGSGVRRADGSLLVLSYRP